MIEWLQQHFPGGPHLTCDICFEPVPLSRVASVYWSDVDTTMFVVVHNSCVIHADKIYGYRQCIHITPLPPCLWMLMRNVGAQDWLFYRLRYSHFLYAISGIGLGYILHSLLSAAQNYAQHAETVMRWQ